MKYTVSHSDPSGEEIYDAWVVRTNDEITGVFWFEKDAYEYVAEQVERRAFCLRNYEVE